MFLTSSGEGVTLSDAVKENLESIRNTVKMPVFFGERPAHLREVGTQEHSFEGSDVHISIAFLGVVFNEPKLSEKFKEVAASDPTFLTNLK